MSRLYFLILAFVNVVILRREPVKSFDDWVAIYRPGEHDRLQLAAQIPLPPVLTSIAEDELYSRNRIAALNATK